MKLTGCNISSTHNSSSEKTTYNLINDIFAHLDCSKQFSCNQRSNLEPHKLPKQAIDKE